MLAGGQIIRDVVDARRAIKSRYRSCNDVIDVNPAENLAGKIDPMRLAVPDPVQNIAAGTVNARQPKNADVRPQRPPRQTRLCPRATPASADRRGFIHPRAASVAINPTGRRSDEHTSELQSLMRTAYAALRFKKKHTT